VLGCVKRVKILFKLVVIPEKDKKVSHH
jgi:hypothetical protein